MIHDNKFFTKQEILRRAKEFEFPNPIAVEYFLWDCELTAQIQSVCDNLILKGGAATQLHLPLQKQRGSKDVDIVTSLEIADIQTMINKTAKEFNNCAKFELHKPKSPTPNLPLQTYLAHVPSQIDTKHKELEVKIDFLCKCPQLKSETLSSVQTYALQTQSIKCLTSGTLTGDKLLSLAQGSIGMDIEENYPKQIYDVDALVQTSHISEQFIDDFIEAIDCLVGIEASYRQIETTRDKVLTDIMSAMQKYSLVDMPSGDPRLKQEIDDFQQFYVNASQRKSRDDWSIKALRINFLAIIAFQLFEQRISRKDAIQLIARCKKTEQILNDITSGNIPKIRSKILGLQTAKMKNFTFLRGKALERVFWQIVNPEKLAEIESIAETQ